MYGVLCGDVRWTAVCMAFCVEIQVGLRFSNFKFGDFKEETTSSLKMI
jgi:hypothetical protein